MKGLYELDETVKRISEGMRCTIITYNMICVLFEINPARDSHEVRLAIAGYLNRMTRSERGRGPTTGEQHEPKSI